MVRGAREALAGDQREAAGIVPTIPGKLQITGASSLVTPSPERPASRLGGHVIPSLLRQNPQILPLKIASSPPPRVQSAIQRGPGKEAPWVPIRLCPRKKGSCVPKLRVPAALEQWGQAIRCRSVLGGWCSRPAWGSRLGLGLHVLDAGQDFLLVSRQSDSNSEQVPREKGRAR